MLQGQSVRSPAVAGGVSGTFFQVLLGVWFYFVPAAAGGIVLLCIAVAAGIVLLFLAAVADIVLLCTAAADGIVLLSLAAAGGIVLLSFAAVVGMVSLSLAAAAPWYYFSLQLLGHGFTFPCSCCTLVLVFIATAGGMVIPI